MGLPHTTPTTMSDAAHARAGMPCMEDQRKVLEFRS